MNEEELKKDLDKNKEDLKFYLSKIVEYFDKANECYFSVMTNEQIGFLDEVENAIDKYDIR